MEKVKVAVLGATGMVGQRFIQLLDSHPWFQISTLIASERSAGKTYQEACTWRQDNAMPESVRKMIVQDTTPDIDARVAFSGLDASIAGDIEKQFAEAGYAVVSNSKNYRMEEDVPLLIPEVNPDHIEIIHKQQKNRGWNNGFIVTNPNCITIPLTLMLAPIQKKWGLKNVFVVTLQAISGAGYPGHSAMDLLDNVIPFIGGEEPKIETESLKILGIYENESISNIDFTISAMVNRVAVIDGHMMSVSIQLENSACPEEIENVLGSFRSLPQELGLPFAPKQPIIVCKEENRPQPRMDRNRSNGMAIVVGRIRECPIFDVKLNVLGHNTIRGAAGAAILNAELLKVKGYLD